MFGPWATTFLVLGCRSAEKLTFQSPLTTAMAPPRRPQDCGTTTTIRVGGGVQEVNFP